MGNEESSFQSHQEDPLWKDARQDFQLYDMLRERRDLDGQMAEFAAANTDPETEPMKSTGERLLDLGQQISERRKLLRNKGKDSSDKS